MARTPKRPNRFLTIGSVLGLIWLIGITVLAFIADLIPSIRAPEKLGPRAAKNYKTIIAIAQKIPEEALQEDEKLLLWYDQALTRTEAGA